MLSTKNEEVTVPGHVCTIKDPRLANAVLIGLVVAAGAAAVWATSAMLAGPWLADSLAVEVTIAVLNVLAFAMSAHLLARALGCGRCGTPQCRCT